MNKAMLIGNLGVAPELRETGDGQAVANLSVATTERWRNRESQEMERRTEWHRVVLFGRLAEIAGEYLHKGSGVYIEGRMQTRKWQDQEGQDRHSTEIVAHSMELLDRKGAESPRPSAAGQAHAEGMPEQELKEESPF